MFKVILTISGFDPSGGAGVHADVKVARALNLHAASVITSLTVQNTCGVSELYPVPKNVLSSQLKKIFDDIKISGIKIGVVPDVEVAEAILEFLKDDVPKVLDPVISASAGGGLGSVEAYRLLLEHVDVATPNFYEARTIFGESENPETIAEEIFRTYGCSVVITGGDLGGKDIVCENGKIYTVEAEITPGEIHGTGCVYSTALTCYLAKGKNLRDSIRLARLFVLESVKRAIRIGKCLPVANP